MVVCHVLIGLLLLLLLLFLLLSFQQRSLCLCCCPSLRQWGPLHPLTMAPSLRADSVWDRFPETETKTSGPNPVSLIRKKAGYKMVVRGGCGAGVFLGTSPRTQQKWSRAALKDNVRWWICLGARFQLREPPQPGRRGLTTDKDKDR